MKNFYGQKELNKITAVDAAASEFDTPPEVFAPVFRELRELNVVRHFTYILEQKIESLYAKLPMIEIKIQEISRKIYNKTYGLEDLSSAWKKRYLDPRCIKENKTDKTLLGEHGDKYEAINKSDFELISLYNKKETYRKYRKPIEVKCFECFDSQELTLLQKEMLAFMHKKEIVIEALPTSNLRIGYHRNLKSYQLLNWYQWKLDGSSIPPIVLGTDDPGIFQTNTYNEYAMIYCYLVYKKGLTRSDVIKFMQEIHDNSRIYAFR